MSRYRSLGDDPVSIEFLTLIGQIVIDFSRIERSLDVSLARGESIIGSMHYRDGQPPTNLKEKIKALRKMCRSVARLKAHVAWVDASLKRLSELSDYRHCIVHGFCHGITDDVDPQIHFRRARYTLSKADSMSMIATRAQLKSLIDELRQAQHAFFLITMQVVQHHRE